MLLSLPTPDVNSFERIQNRSDVQSIRHGEVSPRVCRSVCARAAGTKSPRRPRPVIQ